MDKEMLDIVNDLSKKPTTELALQIMELSGKNLILEQQCKKQKEVIDKLSKIIFEIKDSIEITGGYPSNYIDDLLKILEDKEVSE
jgi:hypothetical protein|nr:MAG TPA: hypothetical protein [Caudoviricetes sp.]